MTDDHQLATQSTTSPIVKGAADLLRQEYEAWQALFDAQPAIVAHFLEAQAQQLADALTQREHPSQLRFTLPDRVVLEVPAHGASQPAAIPPDQREQLAGGIFDRLTRGDADKALRQRLGGLG